MLSLFSGADGGAKQVRNFNAVMVEHCAYAKASIGRQGSQRYIPSPSLAPFFYTVQLDESPPSVNDCSLLIPLEICTKDLGRAEVSVIQLKIEMATLALRNSHMTSSAVSAFRATLEHMRNQAKHDCESYLEQLYHMADKLGSSHCELQGNIFGFMQRISQFFVDLYNQIGDFIARIAKGAAAWIATAEYTTQRNLNEIRTWISGSL